MIFSVTTVPGSASVVPAIVGRSVDTAFVDHVVGGDGYSTGSEFIISLLYREKTLRETELSPEELAKLQCLRTEIQVGVDQLNRGEFEEFDADDLIARGHAKLAANLAANG